MERGLTKTIPAFTALTVVARIRMYQYRGPPPGPPASPEAPRRPLHRFLPSSPGGPTGSALTEPPPQRRWKEAQVVPQKDARPREPEPYAETPQAGPPSAAEVEFEALAQRLRESAEPAEPLGVCVFPAEAESRQATAIRVHCETLSGT